ncbi:unnamed protein product, partial [marine sediment metagenome]
MVKQIMQCDINRIRNLLRTAKHFLICTGAGMSADSGVPVYHTKEGLWGSDYTKTYEHYGLTAEKVQEFGRTGTFSENYWDFWRYFLDQHLYFGSVQLHPGYDALNKIVGDDYYVVTSNIDGAHIRSGLDANRVLECHGALTATGPLGRGIPVQCVDGSRCNKEPWIHYFPMYVQSSKELEEHYLPRCMSCEKVARPNYLSFNDQNCLIGSFGLESPVRREMKNWL